MQSLRYEEFAVRESLRPWILNYWRFSVGALSPQTAAHTVWPDGCTSLAMIATPGPGPRVVWTGPRVTAMQPPLFPHSVMWGVRLWPDCSASVLGIPARQLRDRVGPADAAAVEWMSALLPALQKNGDAQIIAAFDDVLVARAAQWPPPDPNVRRALRCITERRGDVRMPDVADVAGLGLRQLQRRFVEATGLTLREWARVRRLRESLALRLQSEVGWSTIAAEAGFSDHAHLAREFRELVGLPPTHVADRLEAIEHRNVRP